MAEVRLGRSAAPARSALAATEPERQLLKRVAGVLAGRLVDDHLADHGGRATEAEGRLFRQRLLVEARAEILGAEEALPMTWRRDAPRIAAESV